MLLPLFLAAAAPAVPLADTPDGYTEVPVRLVLSIAKSGKVAYCTVLMPAPVELGEASCKAMRETARFEPAHDAKGKPVPTVRTIVVRYRIANR